MAKYLDSTITLDDTFIAPSEKHIVYKESKEQVWFLPEFLHRIKTYMQIEDQDDEPAPARTWLAQLGSTTNSNSTWLINLYLGDLGNKTDVNQNHIEKYDEIFMQISTKLVDTVPENRFVLFSSVIEVYVGSVNIYSQFGGIYGTTTCSDSPITFTGAMDRTMLKRLKPEDSLKIVMKQSVYRDLLEWPISTKAKDFLQRLVGRREKPGNLKFGKSELCAIEEIVNFSSEQNLTDVVQLLEHLYK